MDVYLHENSKTYRNCEIQNNAHRSTLERRTLGLELERKKTSLYLSREEHQLREQLKQMQITKAKNELAHNARGARPGRPSSPVDIVKKLPTEPYPVTFRSNTPSPVEHGKHVDKYGKKNKFRRRRLPSKEFEDVSLETGSNPLLSAEETHGYRRRINSMTSQKRPSLRRHIFSGRLARGGHSSGSSRESLNNGSNTSLENVS